MVFLSIPDGFKDWSSFNVTLCQNGSFVASILRHFRISSPVTKWKRRCIAELLLYNQTRKSLKENIIVLQINLTFLLQNHYNSSFHQHFFNCSRNLCLILSPFNHSSSDFIRFLTCIGIIQSIGSKKEICLECLLTSSTNISCSLRCFYNTSLQVPTKNVETIRFSSNILQRHIYPCKHCKKPLIFHSKFCSFVSLKMKSLEKDFLKRHKRNIFSKTKNIIIGQNSSLSSDHAILNKKNDAISTNGLGQNIVNPKNDDANSAMRSKRFTKSSTSSWSFLDFNETSYKKLLAEKQLKTML